MQMNNQLYKYIAGGAFSFLLSATTFAQDTATTEVVEKPMDWSWLTLALTVTAIILLVTVLLYSSVVKGLSRRIEENSKKMMTVFILLGLQGFANQVFAGDEPVVSPETVAQTSQFSTVLLNAFLIAVILIELILILYLNKTVKILLNVLSPLPASVAQEDSLVDWDKLWNKISGLKPMEQEADLRMNDHIYDGTIQELDNRMPPWLAFIFNATIAFAFIYIFLYHYTNWGPDPLKEYNTEVQEASIKKAAYLDKQANKVNENSVTVLTDAPSISAGETIYKQNCVACHGDKGQGGVGPNLADEYWIHGGGIKDIFKVITYGVEAKGMRSWKSDITPGDIQKVSSFIKSLKGTNPPGGKAPQGEIYKEEAGATTAAPADSTAKAATPEKATKK